jgi:hypothetical protein
MAAALFFMFGRNRALTQAWNASMQEAAGRDRLTFTPPPHVLPRPGQGSASFLSGHPARGSVNAGSGNPYYPEMTTNPAPDESRRNGGAVCEL